MRKKILLVQPPMMLDEVTSSHLKYPPMGIAFLASVLRQQNYEPVIFDGGVANKPFERLESVIKTGDFSIVVISFTSLNASGAFEAAKKIKERYDEGKFPFDFKKF